MNITVAENAGFCFGVRRAALFAEEAAGKGYEVYTLGELIHNRLYLASLAEKGVREISLPALLPKLESNIPLHLIIRTHGIPKETEDYLLSLKEKFPNFLLSDMTCPHVKRIHKIAEEMTGDDTVFLLLSTPEHAEAIGILSHVKGESAAFSNFSEFESIMKKYENSVKTLILASQTTQSSEEFKKCKFFLEKHFTKSKIFDTICNVTEKRQLEAKTLAQKADVMIVVGGKNSSNTEKLYRICKENCEATYRIESAEELADLPANKSARNVCITAGASTPSGLIKEIVTQWKK